MRSRTRKSLGTRPACGGATEIFAAFSGRPAAATTKRSSLLDSEGFYQPRLEEAFRLMPDYQPRDMHELKFDSPVKELDLFITGTDVDGRIATLFDDAGHPIDVKDHRAVFLLKHRADRKEPFKPESGDLPGARQAGPYHLLLPLPLSRPSA